MLFQLTGLPSAGKTTLSQAVKVKLQQKGKSVEVLDGDALRQTINKDLGFSRSDREENIRRLGVLGQTLSSPGNIVIIAAINPFEKIRNELRQNYGAKIVWLRCPVEKLMARDPKGLYKRALLPDGDPEKIYNLTGINDVYEEPVNADLIIDTHENSIDAASDILVRFILNGVD